jgi:hypothetical protein
MNVPPYNLVAQAIDGGAIALSWSHSTPQPTASYTIQYKIGGFGEWMTIGTTPNNSTTNFTIANMNDYAIVNNSTIYCFRISATENVTKGPYSNIAEAMPFNNSLPMYLWSRFSPNCGSNVTTSTSPLTDNLEQQMLRKAGVLRYFQTGSLNFTNSQLWAMAARNQLTRKKGYATQTQDYTNPNTTNMTNPTQPNIGLRQINNSLTCWTPQPTVICNPSSASDVPGKPKTLCFSLKAPYNNYRDTKTYGSGGIKLVSYFKL